MDTTGTEADEIARELGARILDGSIVIGSWLRQEAIASEFGVSRTPVREALRDLQARNLVVLLPHRGARVRGPTVRELREAYLIRAELEGLAAYLACSLIDDGQIARLRSAERLFARAVHARVGRAGASTMWRNAWVRANDLFHESIQEAADNERLRKVIRDLHRALPRNLTWSALSERSSLLLENAKEHTQIRRAIEAHDAPAARTLMVEHVLHSGRLVERWFERSLEADAGSPGGM